MNDLTTAQERRPVRLLETALLFTIAAHLAAMVSMVAMLLPGVPGGSNADVSVRAVYVAQHPWLWRIGWLPWQVTAASDLLLCIALVYTPWIARLPAFIAVFASLAALVPDQSGQFSWTWEGVANARRAVVSGDFAEYARYEAGIFRRTAGWGPLGYITAALAWTWCFAAAGVWSRWLSWLSLLAWGMFSAATVTLFLPMEIRQRPVVATAVSVGNAAAFMFLMLWLALVTEAVLRRSRPVSEYGGLARWRHPGSGATARIADVIANSRLLRAIGRWMPAAEMVSDISDVVYVNYLVEADRLEPLVQRPLALQRLGAEGRYAIFTFLTFRHRHFGPRRLGWLRRFSPSPIQSNWRIHVYNPTTGTRGIQFLSTAITSTLHAIATRLLAENVPMHIPAAANVRRSTDGTIDLNLAPGCGTSPDATGSWRSGKEPALDPAWKDCFGNWRGVLEYCVPQDRAMCIDPASGAVIRQEITLDIPLDGCQPLNGVVDSRAARAIAGGATPLCFAVNSVFFCFRRAEIDRP